MKNSCFLSLFFTSLICFSQNDKIGEDQILFERGKAIIEIIYNNEVYELIENQKNKDEEKVADKFVKLISTQALEHFDKLIIDFPESELLIATLYEKSLLELILENNEKAKKSFLTILSKENNLQSYYRNKSLIELARLYIEEKNYSQALLYLEERTKNGFRFSCGVEYDTTLKRIESLKKVCVEGLNSKKN